MRSFKRWWISLLFFLGSCGPVPVPAQPIWITNSTPEKALTASNLVNVLNTNFARLYGQFSGTTDRTNGTATNTLTLVGSNRVKALGAVVYRSLEERFSEERNVKDYGAIGNGAVDDSAAIQAAVDSLEETGGKVVFPGGVYLILSTINLRSSVTFSACHGGIVDFDDTRTYGSVIKWGGSTGGTMLRCFGVNYVTISGLHLDGDQIPSVTGILIDSVNNPPTHNIEIRDCFVDRIGANGGGNGVGIQVGTGTGIGQYQCDFVSIDNVQFNAVGTGIVMDSGNGFDLSRVEHCRFAYYDYGVHIKSHGGGTFQIANTGFGGHWNGGPMVDIYITGEHGPINIQNCHQDSVPLNPLEAGARFLYVPASAPPSGYDPITIRACENWNPIEVRSQRHINSSGCYWGTDITIENQVTWWSENDRFVATAFDGGGVPTAWYHFIVASPGDGATYVVEQRANYINLIGNSTAAMEIQVNGITQMKFRTNGVNFPNVSASSVLMLDGNKDVISAVGDIPLPGTVNTDIISSQGVRARTFTTATNYTALTTDYLLRGDTTGGGVTITLPSAPTAINQIYIVKKIASANTLTIATTGGETIDGSSTPIGLTTQYSGRTFKSNGTSWDLIGSF